MAGTLVISAAILVAFCVGSLILNAARLRTGGDPIAFTGLSLAVGACVIPLLVLWTPFISWGPLPARLLAGALVGARLLSADTRALRKWFRRAPKAWLLITAAFLVVVIASAATRIDGAEVLPGIDSAHHLMITRLIVEQGTIPHDLSPFIPHGRLTYHWGVHANAAFTAWLLGWRNPFNVAHAILWYAAFLHIVCVLAVYAAGRAIFGDRVVALFAAALAATVSALPAELVTQGRFTHLAGVALLPAILALEPGWRPSIRRSVVTAIVLAGLFLVQTRVALFGGLWIATVSVAAARKSWRALIPPAVCCAFALALVVPWAVRLLHEPIVLSMINGKAFAQADNRWMQRTVPPQLLWLPNSGALLSIATAGVSGIAGFGVGSDGRALSVAWWVTVIATAAVAARRREVASRRGPWRRTLLLASWVVVCGLILAFHTPRVDVTHVVPYAAAALTAFIPVVLAAGAILGWFTRVLFRRTRIIAAGAIFGAFCLVSVATPSTHPGRLSVTAADLRALHWITAELPQSARFAAIARPWSGAFIGYDAGYWVQVLTDRRSILPPAIYAWCLPAEDVASVNGLLQIWTSAPPQQSVPQLTNSGVTHVYIGATADPAARTFLLSSNLARTIYDRDGVLIAELMR